MEALNITVPDISVPIIPLPFGGSLANGETLGVNNKYFTKNGKPWYPVMGEFHFSRYPSQHWEESLLKMRAGGIQIVASYIFWIHHEEEKGKWNFSGQRDLRQFLLLCSKLDFPIFLRLGPWAHGECRNGGFPDWLHFDPSIKNRTNDDSYLDLVQELFKRIYNEAEGLFWKDGGPIIGVQIENEYGHCGGLGGIEGLAHMLTLKELAVEIGFNVPFYTATGWGGANVVDGEMLPVQGGYVDAPWEQHTNQLPANQVFLIQPFCNDPLIGADWGKKFEGFTYQVQDYPYLTAELGGGIQVTKHRRPVISSDDTAAQALCKLASGANLLGYYMYHGGTNPKGVLSTLQETKSTGSYTDVPVLSYDFQACIGEYGEIHQSYRKLKRLHMFLVDFGDIIAPSVPVFPPDMVEDAEDIKALRYNIRHNNDTNTGFVFINNHQRHRKMNTHKNVQISVNLADETIVLPAMDIPSGFYGFFPYNIHLGESFLKSTNAQILCKMGSYYVFFCHEDPIFNYTTAPVPSIILTEEEAGNAWRFDDRLFITKGSLIQKDGDIFLTTSMTEEEVIQYPENKTLKFTFDQIDIGSAFKEVFRNGDYAEYIIQLDEILNSGLNDLFLIVDFKGDRAELFIDGELVADWFTTGLPWRVGLRRFDYRRDFTLRVYPIIDDTYFECEVDDLYTVRNVSTEAQYIIRMPNT